MEENGSLKVSDDARLKLVLLSFFFFFFRSQPHQNKTNKNKQIERRVKEKFSAFLEECVFAEEWEEESAEEKRKRERLPFS